MDFHYVTVLSISKNCFPSIFIFCFQLMHLFWKDFQRNLQDFIQMPDITKRNLNVHVILGNTGHA